METNETEEASFCSLPDEILEQIFLDRSLRARDIINLEKCASRYRRISIGDVIWKRKFRERCVGC